MTTLCFLRVAHVLVKAQFVFSVVGIVFATILAVMSYGVPKGLELPFVLPTLLGLPASVVPSVYAAVPFSWLLPRDAEAPIWLLLAAALTSGAMFLLAATLQYVLCTWFLNCLKLWHEYGRSQRIM